MQTLRGNSWHPWIIVGNILMAAIVGLVVGVLLIFFNIGGLLTIVGVSAFLAIFGIAHYLLWGRAMAVEAGPARPMPVIASSRIDVTPYVVELHDDERKEILELLEQSLANNRAPAGTPGNEALRRGLLNKMRLYGA